MNARDTVSDLRRRVGRLMDRHGLIAEEERVVVACSGGADSMALLDALAALAPERRLRLLVVHVHHGLRGRDADADAALVEATARLLGWPCHVERLALDPRSPLPHESPEAYWRRERYRALRRVARRRRIRTVALGHHRDDLAETVVMRLLRGAGLPGLSGFGPLTERDDMRLVRPLIEIGRDEIEVYCREAEIEWREDVSNRDRRRLRNRVRHDLLPRLEACNPSLRKTLARAAEAMRADEALLEALADEQWRRLAGAAPRAPRALPLAEIRELPLALLRRVARRWLSAVAGDEHPPAFSEVDRLVELIAAKKTGARFELRRQWAFIRERDRIAARRMRRG